MEEISKKTTKKNIFLILSFFSFIPFWGSILTSHVTFKRIINKERYIKNQAKITSWNYYSSAEDGDNLYIYGKLVDTGKKVFLLNLVEHPNDLLIRMSSDSIINIWDLPNHNDYFIILRTSEDISDDLNHYYYILALHLLFLIMFPSFLFLYFKYKKSSKDE